MPTPASAPPAHAVALDAHWAAKMDRLRVRALPQKHLRICDDQTVKDAWTAARHAAEQAREDAAEAPGDRQLAAEAKRTAKALEAARSAYDDASVILTFRAVPRPVLKALFDGHKPTEEQEAAGSEWNEETFPAALISAASVDGMTVPEAQELIDTWSNAEANALFAAAMSAQQEQRMDLGKD